MSEPQNNHKPRPAPAEMIELPNHQGYLIRMSDEDPDAEVDTTPRPANFLPPIQSEPVADVQEELGHFQRVMEELQRDQGHRFLNWRDVLLAIHDMGYRKVAKPRIELDPEPEAQS
jgi:hypothetical protein